MFAKIFRNVSKESILRQKIFDRFTKKKEAPPCLEHNT